MSQPLWIRGVILAAAVLLTGCSAPVPPLVDASPKTSPAGSDQLPFASYFTTVKAPRIDGFAASTGQIGRPNMAQIEVYDAAGGRPFAILSKDESVPVVFDDHQGWMRVMLPSRIALPSAGGPVNGATGWVKATEMGLIEAPSRVFVSKADHRLYVAGAKDAVPFASYPVEIGRSVPSGPTYISPGIGFTSGCTDFAPIQLTVQSEVSDGFHGQSVAPIAIIAPNPDCTFKYADVADVIPTMIRLGNADGKDFSTFILGGVFVDIVDKSFANPGSNTRPHAAPAFT